ncbi:MAG: hypothetical protein JKY96_09350 [Phycisphaerales bacterium]|nr:hypothetical protein [Phycisphaerales bacterium]
MLLWIVLAILLALITSVFTLVWWWIGDQWANEEHKKFKHTKDLKTSEHTRVIQDVQVNGSADGEGVAND